MPLIKDFNKYLLGVEMSDKHHRNLLDIINDLYDSLLIGTNKEILSHYLKRLHVFTSAHFKAEEELMLSVGYPDLTNHKKIHENFINKLVVFKKLNEVSFVGKDLITYLVSWVAEHILITDKAYADFIKNNKKEV